ncbi:MAG TPA: ABC transporter permease [Bacteroidia bacterium]|jgi:lipopolysaccharide transport system permease protein|nr:ABC transporter permease [Bacteroidia bacterium]
MEANNSEEKWDLIIEQKHHWLDLDIRSIWKYKDLIVLFVRRDFVAQYKQTLLGPLWHIIQPLFTTFLFTIIFGQIANIKTDGSPRPLFYLSGLIIWGLFSGTVLSTSATFVNNAAIFGKIYFPRLVSPISVVISNIIRFGIQFVLFLIVWVYYLYFDGSSFHPHPGISILFIPVIVLIISIMGMGCGIIISSLTTKYRDLSMFTGFALQLLMYLSPVIYPAVIWGRYEWVMKYNPITYMIDMCRYAFLGTGQISIHGILYSLACSVILLTIGIILFNRVEKSFMDTV